MLQESNIYDNNYCIFQREGLHGNLVKMKVTSICQDDNSINQ